MFTWKDSYSLGIKDIDMQHKRLLEIGMDLFELMSSKERRQSDKYDEIMESLHQLKEYTIYHFDFEEELLKKSGYKELDDHIAEHSDFIAKLDDLEDQDIDTFQNKVTMELIDYVAKWIGSHILDTDKKYVPFLN